MAQLVKNLPTMWETWVQSLSLEDPLEKGMATHFSVLAWRIPLTEEPFGLQCGRLQRVRHNWAPKHSQHSTFLYIPEVYHVMNWCTHTLWNDYQGQDNEYIHLVTQLTFFFLIENSRFIASKLQVHNTVLLTTVNMLCFTTSELTLLITEDLYLLICISPFPALSNSC